MKRKILIPFFALFIFSCEKISDPEILRFYGDAYEDIGYSVAKSESGYLIAGLYTELKRDGSNITGSEKKMALITTGPDGIQLRKDIFGDSRPASGEKVISLGDGSSVIGGNILDPVSGQDIYIAKVAPGGEGVTEKVYNLQGNQFVTDIIKTLTGYLILGTTDAGSTDNIEGNKNIFLLLVKDDLEIIGTLSRGFGGNDEGSAVKQAGDGSYIVIGNTDRSESATEAGSNIFIMKVSPDLKSTNWKILGTMQNETASDVELVDEGFLIAGTMEVSGKKAGYIWQVPEDFYGPTPNTVVTEHLVVLDGFPESFSINAICKYKNNSFLMAGQYGSPSSGSMLVFATDQFGYFTGKIKISGGTGNQVAYDVLSDGEDVVAVGKNSHEINSMITMLKFRF